MMFKREYKDEIVDVLVVEVAAKLREILEDVGDGKSSTILIDTLNVHINAPRGGGATVNMVFEKGAGQPIIVKKDF